MKKIYSINVHYRIVLPVEIEAESEEEAIRIAKYEGEQYRSLNDYDSIEALDACVTGVEDVAPFNASNVDELTEAAIEYMRSESMSSVSISGIKVTKTKYDTSGGRIVDEHNVEYEIEEVYLDNCELYVRYADPFLDSDEAPEDEPLCDLGAEQFDILIQILEA